VSDAAATKDRFNRAALFGRDAEILRIQSTLYSLSSVGLPPGRVLLLAGNSGVGKSAIAQFVLESAAERGFDVYRIACEPFHEGMSFFPVRELVRQLAGGRTIGEAVGDLYGPASPQADVAAVSDSTSVDPVSRREALVATFTNAILGRFRMPGARPMVIFIDDLEHLDAGSADALICLVARISEGPVFVLGAYRTDLVTTSSHPLKTVITSGRRSSETLEVMPLDGFTSRALPSLTEVMLDGPCDLPQAFYDKLYRETEGNPLFIREVLRTLQSTVAAQTPPLRQRDGCWHFEGSIELWAIPPTVEDVIASRLDLLDPDQRSELEIAAVIGRRFAFEVFNALMESGEDDLLLHLENFLGFDLIRELDNGDDSFEFSHGKIRDVLYESLSGLRRRRIHAKVAGVLREMQGVANEDWDALIGEHLFLAAKLADAFPYLIRAGRSLRSTGSAREAAVVFRKAYAASDGAVLDAAESRQGILLEFAAALIATSETDEAAVLLEQVTTPDTPVEIRAWALNYLGDALLFDGDIDQALDAYSRCEEAAKGANMVALICEVACDLAELHSLSPELIRPLLACTGTATTTTSARPTTSSMRRSLPIFAPASFATAPSVRVFRVNSMRLRTSTRRRSAQPTAVSADTVF
jgi:predicted ATPase